MQMPWRSFQQADKNRHYVALLSYLPLKRYRTLPRFLWDTFRIVQQLREARGLIGYSMEMKLLRRRFWTLSAWESEEALQAFVDRLPHAGTMRALSSRMGRTAFIRWRVEASDLPLTWAAAHERERQDGQSTAV
jgi:heme-degrading monooxygenase HmoA